MAKAENLTASAYGAMVKLGSEQIIISDKTPKVILLNGDRISPILQAVSQVATTAPMDMGGLSLLNEIVKKLGLKPGDANPSADLLPTETGLGGLALAGLMEDNGDALITLPKRLHRETWIRLAEKATEQDIENQLINVHHLFVAQGAYDYGLKDWRAPNMKFEDKHVADESFMLWKFSEAGGREIFDKSGSSPASNTWTARVLLMVAGYAAGYQRFGSDLQLYDYSFKKRPVQPVLRFPLNLGPT